MLLLVRIKRCTHENPIGNKRRTIPYPKQSSISIPIKFSQNVITSSNVSIKWDVLERDSGAHFPQWRRIWCREKTCELRCISGSFFEGLSHQTFDAIILLHSHKTWNNSNLLQSVNQHLKKCINLTQVLKIDWRTRHRNVTLVWQNSSEHRDTVPVVFQIVATQNLELYIHVPFSWGCYISFPGVWNLMV